MGSNTDLEDELTCPICTDVFYQPLTLLDCLHTYCGSCSKVWFASQAALATHNSRNATPYTCPSCRAPVRAARPNATVTNLLDMYLQVNPSRGKTEEEKAKMREKYTPGDDVIPPVEVHPESEDSEDERLMNDVRQMSVADLDPAVEANRRANRSHRGERNGHADSRRRVAADARRRQEAVERNIAHQPSLRSLLSASTDDPAEVREIIQSIMSSGVLDGIDLEALTAEQEDELTEHIIAAVHRRQAASSRDFRDTEPGARARPSTAERSSNRSTPPRNRQPASRPHLIEQWLQDSAQASRQPSQRRESPATRSSTNIQDPPPASRSVTDPAVRSADVSERRPAVVPTPRRSTNPPAEVHQTGANDNNVRRDAIQDRAPHTPPNASRPPRPTLPYPDTRVDGARANQQTLSRSQALAIPEVVCDRCGKIDIQQDLHYHCNKCSNGNFDLCLRCYRTGQGCNHWFGFGYGARVRWDKHAPPGGHAQEYETHHVLTARRYVKKSPERGIMENELQEGAFCEGCFKHADQSYWHCNACFEGAWGYCLACVQQEKHCTHPLAPVICVADQQRVRDVPGIGRQLPLPHLPTNDYYSYLPTTTCAVSSAIIPPDHTRLHCSQCNNGNYDISDEAYNSLMGTGGISNANGLSGWRRCLQGHPMSIVVFHKVLDNVHQRVVVDDVVGGWKARNKPVQASSHIQNDMPSDLRAVALWSWWPADGVEDELAFPKHAELREVEEINTDYFAAVYAGSRGLFPANHVRMF